MQPVGGTPRNAAPGGSLNPLSTFSPSRHFGFGKDDPSGKDLSWIDDVADELAVQIALREFEEGVVLVEKGPLVHPTASNIDFTMYRTRCTLFDQSGPKHFDTTTNEARSRRCRVSLRPASESSSLVTEQTRRRQDLHMASSTQSRRSCS